MFSGKSDNSTMVKNVLQDAVRAKFVRLLPTKFNENPIMRVELFGIIQGRYF